MCKCEQECKLEYVLKLYHLILFLKFNVFVMLSCTPPLFVVVVVVVVVVATGL